MTTTAFFEYESPEIELEENFKRKFGDIPKSIMKFRKSRDLMNLIDNDELGIGTPDSLVFTKRGSGVFKDSPLRYSIYNPDQASFILQYYTEEGDLILDPFMGRATRPAVTLFHGRRYIGFDTCQATVDANKDLLERKFPRVGLGKYRLYKGDGTELEPIRSESNKFDAVFTCPPYYNIEKYSGEDGDLSRLRPAKYDARIQELFHHLYQLIKPSQNRVHPVIFTLGSVRIKDRGLVDMDYEFHSMAEKAGFLLHDKMLTENITPMVGFTFRRNYEQKYVCKNFETTLVFIKK
jgi:DNA modification methylase